MNTSLSYKEVSKIVSIIVAGTIFIVVLVESVTGLVTASIVNQESIVQKLPTFTNEDYVSEDSMFRTAYYSLRIPKNNLDVTVGRISKEYWFNKQWLQFEQVMQSSMAAYGVAAYPHSVEPGNIGTIFLTGHSSPPSNGVATDPNLYIFEDLPQLIVGDVLEIAVKDSVFKYKIESKKIVSPKQTDLLQQQYSTEELVLITCFPVGSTKDRLVFTAVRF